MILQTLLENDTVVLIILELIFTFFWHLQLFHYGLSCSYLWSKQYPFHFNITFNFFWIIIIILIFFFNQRFCLNFGLLNKTVGPHKMWMKCAFKINVFIQSFVFCHLFCGTFGICLHCFRNSDVKSSVFQIIYHQSPGECSSIFSP